MLVPALAAIDSLFVYRADTSRRASRRAPVSLGESEVCQERPVRAPGFGGASVITRRLVGPEDIVYGCLWHMSDAFAACGQVQGTLVTDVLGAFGHRINAAEPSSGQDVRSSKTHGAHVPQDALRKPRCIYSLRSPRGEDLRQLVQAEVGQRRLGGRVLSDKRYFL
ncbi:hypothetical protein DENSPDRAFT_835405 [Dentipellis sp. KUC8613]|nr:hypothetical protein DENSPDRAFT_835405 [Dentipellis sp. KUC8613]